MGNRPTCQVTSICNISVRRIRRYMRDVMEDYMDGTGEINMTGLAESAANQFDLFEVDGLNYDIPEEVFELASDVANEKSK